MSRAPVLGALLAAASLSASGARADSHAEESWGARITPHYNFHHQTRRIHSRFISDIENVHRLLRHEFWSLSNRFQSEKVEFFLYEDKAAYEQGRFRPPRGSGGIALFMGGKIKKWIFATYEGVPFATVAHELTHLFFRAFFFEASESREPPRWLNEGLAVLMEKEIMTKLKRPNEAPPRDVRTVIPMAQFMDPRLSTLSAEWYAQAGSVVRFLREGQRRWKFDRFCRELSQGATVDQALNTNYGHRSIGEFESAWLHWLKKGTAPKAAPAAAVAPKADGDLSQQFPELPE
ncbi:MAG: hypothetical protein HY078_10890 [Elusimicrobia bacterium]|nr:hypothetical protein [Elusimicrobiota bacterium]